MLEVKAVEFDVVRLVQPKVFEDRRGFFQQWFHSEQYAEAGIDRAFVQDNWSHSNKGVVRGLHYQLKQPQAKLVGVFNGHILDVVVDVRRGSPSFGEWRSFELSRANHCQLFIPEGFAHGFSVLSETADVFYKCSDLYAPGDDYGVRWDDPDIGIRWHVDEALLSGKDSTYPPLQDIPKEQLPVYMADRETTS